MKTNELRLENYILCNKKQVATVFAIRDPFSILADTGEISECDIDKCEGVTLTEEWLVKFEFSNYDQVLDGLTMGYLIDYIDYSGVETEFVIVKDDEEGYWLGAEEDDFYYFIYPSKPFRYVHQLQNLYFAITGNELEIKNT